MQWTPLHVKHWIVWAIQEFKLDSVDVDNFNMTGAELCDLTHGDFIKYIPFDRGDIFWTHLELLRKCKFVGMSRSPCYIWGWIQDKVETSLNLQVLMYHGLSSFSLLFNSEMKTIQSIHLKS